MENLKTENLTYWSGRAKGYSEYNQGELQDDRRSLWRNALLRLICEHYPNREPSSIHILDVGTGPGFFALLLAEAGFSVTALDCTENMLKEAKINAGEFADKIHWVLGDAQELPFDEDQFDLIVTRNVTWNLPEPEKAYASWLRVLKPGAALFNFDSNWYHYLFDTEKKKAYDLDRQNVADQEIEDFNVGENFDKMELIAKDMPLSQIMRPAWDLRIMNQLGFTSVDADTEIWKEVWSEIEIINNSSTPTFLVKGIK